MKTLVVREIRDNIALVAGLCVTGAAIIVLVMFCAVSGPLMGILVPWALAPALLLEFNGLGVSQMYGDRANRISALLATQAVTRRTIFGARVLVGLLTILVCLVPAGVMTIVLFWGPLMADRVFSGRTVVEVSVTLLLAATACYCSGLLVGWTTNRAWLLAGNLLLMALVISLVAIKGFGLSVLALLLLFIGAALLRTWHQFSSASL